MHEHHDAIHALYIYARQLCMPIQYVRRNLLTESTQDCLRTLIGCLLHLIDMHCTSQVPTPPFCSVRRLLTSAPLLPFWAASTLPALSINCCGFCSASSGACWKSCARATSCSRRNSCFFTLSKACSSRSSSSVAFCKHNKPSTTHYQ